MARTQINYQEENHANPSKETVSYSGGTAVPMADTVPLGESPASLLSNSGQIVGRVDIKRDVSGVPSVKRAVVLKAGMALINNMRVNIPEGKVVDSNNYDFALLRRSGIKMRDLAEGEDY